MADLYFKFGAAGTGASALDPANAEAFLQGEAGWPGTFDPANDVAVLCPGTFDSGANFIIYKYGQPARQSWATFRVASPGEFPGEMGTELKIVVGGAYNHRVYSPAHAFWYTLNPDTELVIEKSGGDGLGYWQAGGAAAYEITLRAQAADPNLQGARYINLADDSNNGLITYKTIKIRHGRNGNNGPGVVLRDSGNRVRVERLEVSISPNERYAAGLIRCGSGSSYDPGNHVAFNSVSVSGAAETDHLVEAGSSVQALHAELGLMRPHHNITTAAVNDFGVYEVSTSAGQHAGSSQGRVDGALASPPALQGVDLTGAALTVGIFPSTNVDQIHADRPLEIVIDELTEHEVAQPRRVSVELLMNDALMALADTRNVWAEVLFEPDGGGAPLKMSSRAAYGEGQLLSASDAAWSTQSYLTQQLTPVRLVLESPVAVAVGSKIVVKLYVGIAAPTTADFLLASLRTLQEVA